jgi:crotonobetainyl-CoA:carnitine CoA-transferase CaiB-like acyl-CoA transferase
MKKGPLSGVKIVDVSTILMVPYCTRILAHLGADVIKIETLEGDNTRYIGPSVNKGMGAVFLNLNRNKKSISVNLKTKEGKEIIHKLISRSDIFVSNIRKSALERLGFTHKKFLKYNNKIITAIAVGFSSKGPYCDLPAFDDTIQACSGMASYQAVYSNHPSYTSGATADTKGTVLYEWNVVGKNGVPFKSWKFRTMVPDAEIVKIKLENKNEMVGPAGRGPTRLISPFNTDTN